MKNRIIYAIGAALLLISLLALSPLALFAQTPQNVQKLSGALTAGFHVPTGVTIDATGTGAISATTVTGFSPATGKVLTLSNSMTFTATDGSTVTFGAGGAVLYSGGSYVASIAGTTNQISASASTGAVTLSLAGPHNFTTLTSTALLLGAGTSAITASDITYSSPTLTVPDSFAITGAGSLAFNAGGSNQNIILSPSGAGIVSIPTSGGLTIGANAVTALQIMNGAATTSRDIRWQTAGVNRWIVRTDGTAESGGNAGSDFVILNRADDGTAISNAFKIIRSSGNVSIASSAEATTGGAGSVVTSGGIYATKAIISGSSTSSTSTTTGSGIFAGGIGVAGAGWFGSNVNSVISSSGATGGGFFAQNGAAIATANTATNTFSTYSGAPNTWQITARQNSTTPADQTLRIIFGGVAQHTYFNASDLSTQAGILLKVLDTTEATTGGAGSFTSAGGGYFTKKLITASTLTTAAGVTWDLGAANVVSPTSPNRTITVAVGGTTYYVAAKTTND